MAHTLSTKHQQRVKTRDVHLPMCFKGIKQVTHALTLYPKWIKHAAHTLTTKLQ